MDDIKESENVVNGSSSKIPIDSSFEFVPNNPFTVDVDNENKDDHIGYPGFPIEPEKAGILATAKAEFKETSTNLHALHYLQEHPPETPNSITQFYYPDVSNTFAYRAAPPGWSPKEEIQKQTNLDPKYVPRLLASKNPQDFQYRLNDIYEQEQDNKALENGSTFGKIIGGLVGLSPIGSIENFIPLTAIATKAKVGAGFVDAAMKNAPGMLAASAIRAGAKEMDKEEGNLSNFMKETFIDAAFGTVFLGVIGGASSLINLSEFNRMKEFGKKYLKGIGFEYVINKEGDLKGFKAVDTTGGSISAAEVTKAQELADAGFYKGGLFKIPYVGAASLSLLSGNIPGFKYIFGSPLVQLKTSKYKAANAFADSAFEHFITTEGEAKGGVRPPSFESKVKKTKAALTDLKVQTEALFAERNGYAIQSRPAIGIQNAWYASKQKALETLSMDSESTNWISKDDFMDEIQRVIYSEEPSEISAVNSGAAIYRKIIDETYRDYRTAHNLPEDWLPPKTASAYLMRVYDTHYLNENEGQFVQVVSDWLTNSDNEITALYQPINEAKQILKNAKSAHETLIKSGTTDQIITKSARELEALQRKSKKLENDLSNRMRSDPNLFIHIDDFHALSANEIKEIKTILKPINKKQADVDAIQKEVDDLRKKAYFEKNKAIKSRKVETAKSKLSDAEQNEKLLNDRLDDLKKAKDAVEEEEILLQEKMANGEIKQNLYNKIPNSNQYALKDIKNKLKFRETHASDFHRKVAAKAYYNSIMNMNPEDIIADVFGHITGNTSENVLKKRTLPVPDEILYNNNFMTKDLYAKTANYVNYLSKRTHLKTSFENVTVNGGFEELAETLLDEHKYNRELINKRLETLTDKKEIEKEKKVLRKEKAEFEQTKKTMKTLYENRMMGLNKRNDFDIMARRTWMSITAAANLHNLPAMQITDFAFGGFQHGIWPFVRDGVYPIITSMAGMLKTKDSQALREMAPHINLGYQDVLNNYADRNWQSELRPYINMGKFSSGVEKYAHFSALTDLAPYIDNALQHTHGSVIQSRFMELLHKQIDGNLTNKESLYLRKYGIDPKQWAERMVNAYKEADGFKTKLGGYVSKAWQWQDLEAANLFNDAVFRGVQNTLVWKGMADSPFFADNILGLFFHTFTGWGYAATNRYLIPSLQHPDGELLLKMIWMAGAGALVSPTRRIARGEEPWPEDMTSSQIAYEAFSDSGVLSTAGNVLNIANFLSSDKLLGDLKNDKFKNRTRTGIFGMSDVVSSTASRISDVIGMANSGINEKDMKTAAHMLAISGAMYGHYVGDKLIESAGFPRNKRAAQAE